MKLRLILGDQLNLHHPWFDTVDQEVTYILMEMRQETDYAPHHIQKVVGFFGAMRHFAQTVQQQGHQVIYLKLDDAKNQQYLPANLNNIIAQKQITSFEYQGPDEYRLDQQLKSFCEEISLPTRRGKNPCSYPSLKYLRPIMRPFPQKNTKQEHAFSQHWYLLQSMIQKVKTIKPLGEYYASGKNLS